jgi:hypothetical protein
MVQNIPLNKTVGLTGINWEIAFHFIDYLADVLTDFQNYLLTVGTLIRCLFNLPPKVLTTWAVPSLLMHLPDGELRYDDSPKCSIR